MNPNNPGSVPASALMKVTRERWEKIAIEPRHIILLAMIDRAKSGHTSITWPNACTSPDSDLQLAEAEIAWLRLNGYTVNSITKSQRIASCLPETVVTMHHDIKWEP